MEADRNKKFSLSDDRKVLEFLAHLNKSVLQKIVAVDREKRTKARSIEILKLCK